MHSGLVLLVLLSLLLMLLMLTCFVCFIRSRRKEDEEFMQQMQLQAAQQHHQQRHMQLQLELRQRQLAATAGPKLVQSPSGQLSVDSALLGQQQQQQQEQQAADRAYYGARLDQQQQQLQQQQQQQQHYLKSAGRPSPSQQRQARVPTETRSDITQQINSAVIGSSEAEFQNDFIQVFPMYQIAPQPEKNTTPYLT